MKRIISLALALVLTLALVPMLAATPAIANGETPEIITFGDIDWRVLYTDTTNNRKLIITENIIEQRRYHSAHTNVTWETSEMRAYLNDEFLDSFNEADRARILETTVINNNNPWLGTAGGSNTQDHIFLLSIEEVVQYFGDSGQLINRPGTANTIDDQYNENRIALDAAGTARWWWLRSPGNNRTQVARVFSRGAVGVDGESAGGTIANLGSVRPALWLAIPCDDCEKYDCECPCPDCGNTPCEPCDDCEKCPCECPNPCPDCEKCPCECIDDPTPNSGIDYTPWQANNHLIVSSTSTDTATINLTTETIDLAGFTPTQFSINGGQRWRNVRADSTTFTTRFPAMLNRGMTLHIRDSAEETANIITFPQINRRPRAPRVQINFLLDHDPTGQTPGYWLLTNRPNARRGETLEVLRGANIQLALPATETRPNGRVRVLNTANELGWGQFFNGEGDRGIPVLPLPENNRVTRTRYLVRLAPSQEADNTFTPASRTGRVNVSSERRPTRLSVRERTATANREASATLRVRANTFVQLPGGEPTLHEARIDINVLEVSGNIYVWQAAAVNGRRPASARQVITR